MTEEIQNPPAEVQAEHSSEPAIATPHAGETAHALPASTPEHEAETVPEPEIASATEAPTRDAATDRAIEEALFAPDEPKAAASEPVAAEFEPEPATETASAAEMVTQTAFETPAPAAAEVAPAAAFVSSPARANLAVSALSDIGCVRTNNEDAYGYDSDLGIFVVCDGMGGMAAGEVASSNAVAALVNTFADSAGTALSVGTRLQHAVHTANRTVWDLGQLPEHKGMGTTTVAAALDGDKLIIANVGDSRAYVLQGGQAAQVTVDHSYLNELIRNGTLTKENAHLADLHGYESVITRAIGVSETVEPDFYSVDLTPGTFVLIASDGLTRYVQQDEIAAILQSAPFEKICTNLIDLAKLRGGHDNITCILLLSLPPGAAQPAQ